jgi:cytoskeletal protein RodZ
MGTFGLQLRRERENRGLRLVDVSKRTRVGVHHLAALEHEDLAALPNEVFVKGYLRAYAECLGLDPSALVAEYVSAAQGRRPAPEGGGEDAVVREMSRILVREEDRAPRTRLLVLALGAVVGVGLVAGWWMRRGDAGADAPPAIARAGPAADPAAVSEAGRGGESRREMSRVAPTSAPAPSPPTAPDAAVPRPATDVETSPEPPPAAAVVPPARRTERSAASAAPASSLAVAESGVGIAVVDRRLVGEAARFAPGAQVYFWTRVEGGRAGERLRHVWFHDGRELASIPLQIGGSHWRTQSRQTLWNPGSWAVEARDDAGRVLARAEFSCAEP